MHRLAGSRKSPFCAKPDSNICPNICRKTVVGRRSWAWKCRACRVYATKWICWITAKRWVRTDGWSLWFTRVSSNQQINILDVNGVANGSRSSRKAKLFMTMEKRKKLDSSTPRISFIDHGDKKNCVVTAPSRVKIDVNEWIKHLTLKRKGAHSPFHPPPNWEKQFPSHRKTLSNTTILRFYSPNPSHTEKSRWQSTKIVLALGGLDAGGWRRKDEEIERLGLYVQSTLAAFSFVNCVIKIIRFTFLSPSDISPPPASRRMKANFVYYVIK